MLKSSLFLFPLYFLNISLSDWFSGDGILAFGISREEIQ